MEMGKAVLEQVLSKEFTARWLLDSMIKRGVQVNIDPAELTHEEIKKVVREIYRALEMRDAH